MGPDQYSTIINGRRFKELSVGIELGFQEQGLNRRKPDKVDWVVVEIVPLLLSLII